jgi:Tfp pilus assembly protein PilN
MTANEYIMSLLIVGVSSLLMAVIITGGVYYYHKLQIDNFQKTILNLSDEQKCLHICGFEFDGYFESYKFCAEKCDRISERLHEVKI